MTCRGSAGGLGLSQQIGETLWADFVSGLAWRPSHSILRRQHLGRRTRLCGRVGRPRIAIAYKPARRWPPRRARSAMTAASNGLPQHRRAGPQDRSAHRRREESGDADSARPRLRSQVTMRRSLQVCRANCRVGEAPGARGRRIKHNLTLPHSDLLRRFYDATGIDDLLTTLRDLNQNAAEYLRREQMDEQARKTRESTETVAEVQSKLECLEVFIVGVYAIEMFDVFTKYICGDELLESRIVMGGSLAFLIVVAACDLAPWKRKPRTKPVREGKGLPGSDRCRLHMDSGDRLGTPSGKSATNLLPAARTAPAAEFSRRAMRWQTTQLRDQTTSIRSFAGEVSHPYRAHL